mgnify:CR=1 FL=1
MILEEEKVFESSDAYSLKMPIPNKRQRTGLLSEKVRVERFFVEKCIESKETENELLKERLVELKTKIDKKREKIDKLKSKNAKSEKWTVVNRGEVDDADEIESLTKELKE